MIRLFFAIACAVALPAALSAEDKYTLKLYHGKQGDAALHEKETTQVEAVTITGPDGNVVEDKKKTTTTVNKYREEILAKETGKRPTKIKRVYSTATRKVDDDYQKLAYHEKTVMIELKDGKYTFSVDGKELSTEEAADLAKEIDPKKPADEDMDKILLPGKAVAVGESWELDGKTISKIFGDDEKLAKTIDAAQTKASGKLVKAFKKDGHQFGTMEYKIEVPLKALEGQHPFREGGKIELVIAGDMCIDGTLAGNAGVVTTKFAGTADIVQDEKKTGITVKIDVSGKEKDKTEPAK